MRNPPPNVSAMRSFFGNFERLKRGGDICMAPVPQAGQPVDMSYSVP